MTILLNILAIIVIGLGVFMIIKDKSTDTAKGLNHYKPEHIADFVAFAKTQLYLPRTEAIQAIRHEFRHLELIEATEVYELAKSEQL